MTWTLGALWRCHEREAGPGGRRSGLPLQDGQRNGSDRRAGRREGQLFTRPSSIHLTFMHQSALTLSPGLVVFQVRWTDSSAGFQTQIKHLVGDVLLSAGFLSYAGPFNQEYRSLLLELWKKELEEKLIPFSPVRLHGSDSPPTEAGHRECLFRYSDYTDLCWFHHILNTCWLCSPTDMFLYFNINSFLVNMYLNKRWIMSWGSLATLSALLQDLNVIGLLVDNATVSEWNLQGLPNDDLSIQNGIVVTKASRYPLLIDPQGQGKTWIQNRERDQQLQVSLMGT